MKRLYGIVGWPVWHTRSPLMHNAALEAVGIDGVYVPFGVRPGKLAEAVKGLSALGVRGVNVTLPHKSSIIELLDEVDDKALAIGAVNTVTFTKGRSVGTNTDAPGLVKALEEAEFDPKGAKVVIIGGGGAARAAVAGLAAAGASRITVASRRPSQAEGVRADLDPVTGQAEVESFSLDSTPKRAFKEAGLLVQATSATLDDGPEASKFAATLPLELLPKKAVVTDLVYAPRLTTVIRAAEALGLKTVDGLGMLLQQGAIAFAQWTGKEAPIAVMKEALG